jgi:hypothetical protein
MTKVSIAVDNVTPEQLKIQSKYHPPQLCSVIEENLNWVSRMNNGSHDQGMQLCQWALEILGLDEKAKEQQTESAKANETQSTETTDSTTAKQSTKAKHSTEAKDSTKANDSIEENDSARARPVPPYDLQKMIAERMASQPQTCSKLTDGQNVPTDICVRKFDNLVYE